MIKKNKKITTAREYFKKIKEPLGKEVQVEENFALVSINYYLSKHGKSIFVTVILLI